MEEGRRKGHGVGQRASQVPLLKTLRDVSLYPGPIPSTHAPRRAPDGVGVPQPEAHPLHSRGGMAKAGQEAESRMNSDQRRLGSGLTHRGPTTQVPLPPPGEARGTLTGRAAVPEVCFLPQSRLCPHPSCRAHQLEDSRVCCKDSWLGRCLEPGHLGMALFNAPGLARQKQGGAG